MKIEYNNIYTHFVLTTLNRQSLILEKNRDRIEKYVTGIINQSHCKLYAIYANPEHMHILLSKAPFISEERIVTILANSTAKFINENNLCHFQFDWQPSCAAFSVSKSEVDRVCKYILSQPNHHLHQTFEQEYNTFIQFYQKTLIVE